jgi:hypothetical protein
MGNSEQQRGGAAAVGAALTAHAGGRNTRASSTSLARGSSAGHSLTGSAESTIHLGWVMLWRAGGGSLRPWRPASPVVQTHAYAAFGNRVHRRLRPQTSGTEKRQLRHPRRSNDLGGLLRRRRLRIRSISLRSGRAVRSGQRGARLHAPRRRWRHTPTSGHGRPAIRLRYCSGKLGLAYRT